MVQARGTAACVDLARLEGLRLRFGRDVASRRLDLMRRLGAAPFRDAGTLHRFHEVLSFARAYPDNRSVLALATRLLVGFAKRSDLTRLRDDLADSGIVGTDIHNRLFAQQAQWLARHWPAQLEIDRDACDAEVDDRIARVLPSMLPAVALQAMVETKVGGFEALDRLRAAHAASASTGRRRMNAHAVSTTDAVILLRAIASMPGDSRTREAVSDSIDAAYLLRAGPTTPSRTLAALAFAPVVFRSDPPPLARPDLRTSLRVAPKRVRRLSRDEGRQLADAAQAAMVTRARSLEAFSFANPADGWLVDDGDGLAFALLGVLPQRRHPVAAWIGGLTLRNGVPIGYTQADLVGSTAALSFNTFETFRGAEAAFTFVRWLAALHRVFGTTSFSIEPYQLGGKGNDEGLASGAFWFYAKLGFAPRDGDASALLVRERERMARDTAHRSTPATLRRLAASHLHFDLGRAWGLPRLAELGWKAGSTNGSIALTRAVQSRCGVEPSTLNDAQHTAWRALAPLLALAPWSTWTRAQRLAVAAIVAAKAAASEVGFVHLAARHEPFMHWLVSEPTDARP